MYKFLEELWKEFFIFQNNHGGTKHKPMCLPNLAAGENVSLAVLSNRLILTTFDSKKSKDWLSYFKNLFEVVSLINKEADDPILF